ncbi:MAG: nitroreductase family protein [Spirochaetales bacterium]|nr:nitroreductase family protein [Spirochaetales bacterium]MCF7938282.1 nitroreductase family protein [Spirochaetales bacterium]
MELFEIINSNRSYRRFTEDIRITRGELKSWVESARRSPSGANMQPLRYHLSADKEEVDAIFPLLTWAGDLVDWDGPEPGDRPAAYITVLRDTEVRNVTAQTDAGIAMQSILLSAVEQGYGGCIFGAVDKGKLKQRLGLAERYEVLYVIALGVPAEEVKLEEASDINTTRYYRDNRQVHHVPKIPLDNLLV